MTKDEARLLDHLYHAAAGNTHKPLNIPHEGAALGLDVEQTERLIKSLLDQDYLRPVDGPSRPEVYVTDLTIKTMGAIKTRDAF